MVSIGFSANERNHLFLSEGGKQFNDVSAISGTDNPADGRSFALLDFDRDGWMDIALVNSSTPLFNIYRNRLGEIRRRQGGGSTDPAGGGILALRLVGGNRTARPSSDFSNRDGCGAQVQVKFGETTLLRENRFGEGLAAQNSATLVMGIGSASTVDAVTIRWPSGKVQELPSLEEGLLVTVFENPEETADGSGFKTETYRRKQAESGPLAHAHLPMISLPEPKATQSPSADEAPLRMYTTTATWCLACKKKLPQLAALREAFCPEEIQMLGVPVSDRDDPEKLANYVDRFQPPYEMLAQVSPQQVADFTGFLTQTLHSEVMPSTVITNPRGEVLLTIEGVPSISQLKALLSRVSAEAPDTRSH
jgi:thiol-disulfide isomerase/thioredoxin